MVRRVAAIVAVWLLGGCLCPAAAPEPVTLRVAHDAMERWPDGRISAAWGFEPGIALAGLAAVWQATKDPSYLLYLQHAIDRYVQPDGTISTYDPEAWALNNILPGRELLLLYERTHQQKYLLAAKQLWRQIEHQPRTPSGGLVHAKATGELMLLDDQFMLAPFYAAYAAIFHEPQDLDDIGKQFQLLQRQAANPETGLLYHGWDESHKMSGANPSTGLSASLWARSMGWYLMALVDILPYLPAGDAQHQLLLRIFQVDCAAVLKVQDAQAGLWYQILDQPHLAGNYFESSSNLMLVYAFAKGARLGYLPHAYKAAARRAWGAANDRFVHRDPSGTTEISGTVTHVALGATAADDGSPGYYLHAPVVSNDAKGVGAFLLAGSEMELH